MLRLALDSYSRGMTSSDLSTRQDDRMMGWLAGRKHDFVRLKRRMDANDWDKEDPTYVNCCAAIEAIGGIIEGIAAGRKPHAGMGR